MPHCYVCELNGEDDSVVQSHNKAAFTKCCYHPRHPASTRKVSKPHDDDIDSVAGNVDLPADLQKSFASPMPTGASRVPRSEPVDGVCLAHETSPPGETSVATEAELLKEMFARKISKDEVVQILSLRFTLSFDAVDEKRIQKALTCANAWVPPVDPLVVAEEVSDGAKELADLQKKRGKLVGTLSHSYKHVMHELHINKRGMLKELYEDTETGKNLIKSSANDDVSDWNILHLVLLDFVCISVAFEHLSDVEGRTLHRCAAKHGYHNSPCILVFRTVQRLLGYL